MFVCAECGASQTVEGRCAADGTPLSPIGEDLLLGTTIGAYRVAHLLGIGGMGRVYKGVQPQIGSRVAIKVLSRECSDRRDLVDRFFSEAKAVNLIRHESIVNVLDLATLPDGRPYIVMEYLDGVPLAAIIEQARRQGVALPIGGIARLVAEVLEALGAAHAKGIVHRDLKPDNIFVAPSGRPKVLDFGIAKLQPELGGSATHTGSLLGTPHYMSPEQASGRAVDARADLYAIGVILFELTTLQKPFHADSLYDLLRKHVEAPPPSARALRTEMERAGGRQRAGTDLPIALEHVIYTALAKPPDQRFGSAQAMSMALQQATAQVPPDQWTPLTWLQTNRPPANQVWSATPPASWATSPRSHASQLSTVSAGQVTGPGKSSRRGLWIAISAVVLVGGMVTSAVIASSGREATPAAGSGIAIASGDPAKNPENLIGPTQIKTASPEPPVPVVDLPDDGVDIDGQIDQVLGEMPQEALAEMPGMKAALKKYGSFAKIPKAERKKLLGGVLGAAGVAGNEISNALAGGEAHAAAHSGGAVGQATAGPLAGGAWVVNTNLDPPTGFDATKLAADAYLAFALKEAQKRVPDAVLFRIDATGVHADGHADITAIANGSLDYRFVSPSRIKGDPKVPVSKREIKCMFRIIIENDGPMAMPMNGFECKSEKLIGPPKCSLVAVWKKALARKAPAHAIASLGYREADGVGTWYFDIPETGFSQIFRDDC